MNPPITITKKMVLKMPDTGPAHDPKRPHYFVVITNECAGGDHLLAPICTVHGAHDPACLLDVGDHDDIVQPSFMLYAMANRQTANNLRNKIASGLALPRNPMADAVFVRVTGGLMQSQFAAPMFQSYYAANKKR